MMSLFIFKDENFRVHLKNTAKYLENMDWVKVKS